MNGRKQIRDTRFVKAKAGRRKKPPKPHEVEPVSVDFVDDAQLVDGDPSNISVEPQGRPGRGERAMLGALLEVAISDARRGDQDAIRWLMDDAERGAPGTFVVVEVLDHLGLERTAFLEKLHVLLRRVEQRQDTVRSDRVALEGALAA